MAENMEQEYKQLQEFLKSAEETAQKIQAELRKDAEFGSIYLDQSKLEVLEKIAGSTAENSKLLDSAKPEIDKLRLLPEHEALKAQKAQMESSGVRVATLMGKLGCPIENMEFATGYAERLTELRKYAANAVAFNKMFVVKRPVKKGNIGAECKVGSYITFGTYPQTEAGNDSTPIEWLVLARDGDKVLVISNYALDHVPYDTEFGHDTWDTCSLRRWLNNVFYNMAFSAEEKQSIVLSKVTADKNPHSRTNPGNDTKDNVFLLSIPEVNKYFKDDASRMCAPTDYAVKNGAYTSVDYKADGWASCGWWLLSPGNHGGVMYVGFSGSVDDAGPFSNYSMGNVRPCMWVRLS